MANLDLYFEQLSKQLASSEQGPLGFQLPALRQEDTIGLDVSIIKQISTVRAPLFEVQNISGYSLRATVGTLVAGVATALATTIAFTAVESNTKLRGSLALNTAAVNALSDSASVFLELIATDGDGNVYGRRFATRVEKAIYASGVLVAPADDTALGRLEADRRYVKLDSFKGGIWESENGTKAFVYLHDDGTIRADPLS
jgi:hypothetical protein